MEHLSVEIYEKFLLQLVSGTSLSEDFEERASPFNERLLPFPSGRTKLAREVTHLSTFFYDLAMPIVWQYLVVNTEKDLNILLDISDGKHLRKTRRPFGQYTTRIDFKSWRRVDMERSILLLSRLPNLEILSIECHVHPGPLWRHPLNEEFYRGLPTMFPNLRRLQLLDAREAPTLEEVAYLSRKCVELRSLHIAHLSEPYQRFVGPDEEEDFEDEGADSTEGEFVTTVHRGDTDSEYSSGSSRSTDSRISVTGLVDRAESDEDDDGDSDVEYRDRISTRFPVALVGPADKYEGNPLAFEFSKLRNLAIGMGNIHGSISERRSMRKLIDALAIYRPSMTELKRVEVYVPLDGLSHVLTPFNDLVETCVLHMYYRAQPRAYVLLQNLTRLLVVIHTAYISIPLGLNRLEEFEVLLRRPAFASNFATPRAHGRMVLTAQALMNILLQDRYPALRSVVLWKGTVAHHASIEAIVDSHRDKFLKKGISLSIRTRGAEASLPIRHPSPIV